MNPSEGVREIEEEAEEIVGALILKEKPSIKKLEELLKDESKKPVEILPDGSIAVGWRKDLTAKIAEALTQAEKRGFERKQETLEAENKRLREALRYIYDNCDSEQEKWAEQTAKEALGGEV